MKNPQFTPEQLAARWGMSVSTLANWRSRGIGPGYAKPSGKTIRYPLDEVEAWEQEHMRGPRCHGCED